MDERKEEPEQKPVVDQTPEIHEKEKMVLAGNTTEEYTPDHTYNTLDEDAKKKDALQKKEQEQEMTEPVKEIDDAEDENRVSNGDAELAAAAIAQDE